MKKPPPPDPRQLEIPFPPAPVMRHATNDFRLRVLSADGTAGTTQVLFEGVPLRGVTKVEISVEPHDVVRATIGIEALLFDMNASGRIGGEIGEIIASLLASQHPECIAAGANLQQAILRRFRGEV